MSRSWRDIHPSFRLNGINYCFENLWSVGYSLVKEGDNFEKTIGDFLISWADEKDVVLTYTSGSTGAPKEIKIKKQHMVNSALATGDFFGLRPKQSALLCLSSQYIAGKMMLVRAMVLGLRLDYTEPTSKPLKNALKNYDFCAMTPLQVKASFKHLSRVKKLIIGGAPVSKELEAKLKNLNTDIYETYGMTETITHVAAKKLAPEPENSFELLPDIEMEKDGRDCLVINATHIADEKIVTNDVVELIDENHFKWLGRFDNVINSGGIKLIPETIEKKLSYIIPNRFFVTDTPDENLGSKLVLLVEGKGKIQTLKKEILESKLLDQYEIPKEIFYLPNFAETESGKISRKETLRIHGFIN